MRARQARAHERSLTQILTQTAGDDSRARISVRDLLLAMQDRTMVALIFVFAVPNAIPLPPGASSMLGAPLLFLTAQLACGRSPWLPRPIADRSIGGGDHHHLGCIVCAVRGRAIFPRTNVRVEQQDQSNE